MNVPARAPPADDDVRARGVHPIFCSVYAPKQSKRMSCLLRILMGWMGGRTDGWVSSRTYTHGDISLPRKGGRSVTGGMGARYIPGESTPATCFSFSLASPDRVLVLRCFLHRTQQHCRQRRPRCRVAVFSLSAPGAGESAAVSVLSATFSKRTRTGLVTRA
jgi:hypothetical protein